MLFNFSSTYDARDNRFLGVRATTKLLSFCECWTVTLAVTGAVVGLAAAIALGRFARGVLFQISPADPLALAAAVLVMFGVAVCAGLVPARRAASVDPVVALRHE